jgi:hypothetical protein
VADDFSPATNQSELVADLRIEINPQKVGKNASRTYYARYRRRTKESNEYSYIGRADLAAAKFGGRIAARWEEYKANRRH